MKVLVKLISVLAVSVLLSSCWFDFEISPQTVQTEIGEIPSAISIHLTDEDG